jgi:hypothetical protein
LRSVSALSCRQCERHQPCYRITYKTAHSARVQRCVVQPLRLQEEAQSVERVRASALWPRLIPLTHLHDTKPFENLQLALLFGLVAPHPWPAHAD